METKQKERLMNDIESLKDSRLKEYYIKFINNHEDIIFQYKKKNWEGIKDLRITIEFVLKALFHEAFKADAEKYYIKTSEGTNFTLDIKKPFYIMSKKSSEGKIDNLQENPSSLFEQIAAAIGSKLGFGSSDLRYKLIRSIHNDLHKIQSNGTPYHAVAEKDKSSIGIDTQVERYDNFIKTLFILYKDNISIKNLSESLSSISAYDKEVEMREIEEEIKINHLQNRLKDNIEESYANLQDFILITPRSINEILAQSLTRIPWNLIFSFDPEGDKPKHFLHILKDSWKGKRPLSIDDITSDGSLETAFINANGNSINSSKENYFSWKKVYKSIIEKAIQKIRKGDSGLKIICVFNDSYIRDIFEDFIRNILSEQDDLIIIGNPDDDIVKQLKKEIEFDKDKNIFNIGETDAAVVFNGLNFMNNDRSSNAVVELSKDFISRLKETGIRIVEFPMNIEKSISGISSFYQGCEVTILDLYNDFDVKRELYNGNKGNNGFFHYIEKRVTNGDRFLEYIKENPCSGITTMLWRLCYDLAYFSKQGKYKGKIIFPIFISELKRNVTENILAKTIVELYDMLPSQAVMLCVFDRSIVSASFDQIYQKIRNVSENNISFIRVSKNDYTSYHKEDWELKEKLTDSELIDFNCLYKKQDKTANFIGAKNVIDFPLLIEHTDVTNISVKEYVTSVLGSLSGEKRHTAGEFLSLLGFCSEFIVNTNNYTDWSLFDKICGEKFQVWYEKNLNSEDRFQLEKLIEFEVEGERKTRTKRIKSKFSRINGYLMDSQNKSLTELTLQYIDIFFSYPNMESYMENYIYNVFFKREEYDDAQPENKSGNYENQFFNKISLLFKKIKDAENIDRVYDKLECYIGNDTKFLMSKAQFIYNKAYFINNDDYDSENFLNARNILDEILESQIQEEDVSLIYQYLGMSYYRQLGALRRKFSDYGEDAADKYQVAKNLTDMAISKFNMAIDINKIDTYSMVSKSQCIQSFLNLSTVYLDDKEYLFAEKEPYIEYINEFNKTVSMIGKFVEHSKDKTTSQKVLLDIYIGLRGYKYKKLMGGDNKIAIFDNLMKKIQNNKNASNLHKTVWADELYDSQISDRIPEITKDLNRLSDKQLKFIQDTLYESIALGNIEAYYKIFLMHLHSNHIYMDIPYSMKEEIMRLKTWMEKDLYNPQAQLWGNYYLYVLYYTKILINGKDIDNAFKLGSEYLKKVKIKADETDLKTIHSFYYFKDGTDLDAICANMSDASRVAGVYKGKINERGTQAKILLDCGLEATFNPKRMFNDVVDLREQTRISGFLGFRFSGLGLYEPKRLDNKAIGSTEPEEIIEEYEAITDDLSTEENNYGNEKASDLTLNKFNLNKDNNSEDVLRINHPIPETKVLGKIKLTDNKIIVREGDKYEGVVKEQSKYYGKIKKVVQIPNSKKIFEIRGDNSNKFEIDEKVFFIAKKEPNKNNPNSFFWYTDEIFKIM